MSVTHTVVQGEYLSLIALRFGFRDQRVIWDHPDNAELKRRRKNPNVLFPGDVVVIPDRAEGRAAAATGRFNAFETGSGDVLVTILFEDRSARPMGDRAGDLTVGRTTADGRLLKRGPTPARTAADGRFPLVAREALSRDNAASEGAFVMKPAGALRAASFRFLIGDLDPVDTPSGQRARLNNLGYFAGFSDRDEDQLAWAIEEFQCDEKMTERGLTGTLSRDRKTLNRLALRHGDMLPGEEL